MRYGMHDIGRNPLRMGTKPDKLRKDEFWAVDGVSFEVKRGETLGIIGPNGSGKSTILKMLNGIFMPDKGRIEKRSSGRAYRDRCRVSSYAHGVISTVNINSLNSLSAKVELILRMQNENKSDI